MSTSEANQPLHRNGFDVILGNPPWERVKLQDQEFFAQRDPAVAGAPNAAARKRAIAALNDTNPSLLKEFHEATRQAEGESHLLRSSGRYPLCGRGDINTYAVFAESMRDAIGPTGRLGVIVPTGIATDDTTKFYFGDLVESGTLVNLFSFENEEFIFPGVHHSYNFSLLTVAGSSRGPQPIDFVFYARQLHDLTDAAKRFQLSSNDIRLLNPNTKTCAVFRWSRGAEITKAIYRRVPVLIREARDGNAESNPWGLTFAAMFHMANASHLFIAPEVACPAVRESLASAPKSTSPFLPLYEAKMLHQFDHRWATYAREDCDWLTTPILTRVNKEGKLEPDARDSTMAEKADPSAFVAPRYWVRADEIDSRLIQTDKDGNVRWQWKREWMIGFRNIARVTDERTLIASVLPRAAVGHSAPLIFLESQDARQASCLLASVLSFTMDYVTRQKVGGVNMTFGYFQQFPVLPPSTFAAACPWDGSQSIADWIAPRVLELVYTAHDLAGFARDLGYDGPPFRWDPARRAQIRAELDAAFFHLYGINRDDAAYILDTFVVFKAREEERNGGVYKTKQAILSIHDEMAEAMTAAPASPVITPTILPPTRAQIDRGRAAAYLTLLAATWSKPVERQVIEYALVLMLNDTVRAKILAQPRSGTGATAAPTQTRHTHPSHAIQARTFVQGLDTMIDLLHSNQMLKVTTQAGAQRIELGLAGSTATQSLPQSDWAKAKDAVAAFEVLRANLQRLDSLADAKDLEFSVA